MKSREKTITKIEIQKRNKNRVNIYINEEFALACDAELIYIYNLCKGKKVDIDYLQEIIDKDNYIKCKNQAFRIIEKSYKTEKQIYDRLVQKDYGEKTIKKTMEFLKQYNLVNDEKYVEMYIKDKISSQGKNKIKYDLIKKGISELVVSEKLNNINDSIEEDTAVALAEKKYNTMVKNENDYRKIYKKLGDYLIRNGYNPDIVQKVLNNLVKKENNSLDDINEKSEEINKEKDKLYELAEKRYRIIIKSESDDKKIYKKLADYLLRRGYDWDSIKTVLNFIVKKYNI